MLLECMCLTWMLTHEQVIGIWIRSSDSEQLHKVVELTMDITAHCHWAFLTRVRYIHLQLFELSYHWLDIRFFLQYLACLSSILSAQHLHRHWIHEIEIKLKGCSRRVRHKTHTFSHNLWTSTSASCLQAIKLSIHPSKVGIDAGSAVVEGSLAGSGNLPTSSMLVSILSCSRNWPATRVSIGGELELINDDKGWRRVDCTAIRLVYN